MKPELRRILLALIFPLFLLFILYVIRFLESGMDWNFTHWGIYPRTLKGVIGIFSHPLVHSSWTHLLANTFPLMFLSWCIFYFYRDLGAVILLFVWIVGGFFTFIIGQPGWHIGASGLIYSLAFFLFFSGFIKRLIPLIAISLLVTFLYGGLVWNMFPTFAAENTSWEGHLSGAMAGIIASVLFRNEGPQRKNPFEDEEDDENEDENDDEKENQEDDNTYDVSQTPEEDNEQTTTESTKKLERKGTTDTLE